MPQSTDHPHGEPRPAGLDTLNPEIAPPDGLEERVVRALREEGLVRPAGAAGSRGLFLRAAAMAAGLLLAAGLGFGGGRMSAGPAGPVPGTADYILLVRPGPAETAPLRGDEERRRIREYSRWVLDLAARGQVVGGEKLAVEGGFVLAGGTRGGSPARENLRSAAVQGYFLIRASNDAEAERIASTCPHLDYGGVLEVRRIDRLEERS